MAKNENNNYVVIIENAQTKLQLLLKSTVTNLLERTIIGTQANQIIQECKSELKDLQAPETLIKQVETGLKATFMQWFNIITARLLKELKRTKNPYFGISYKTITGVEPKEKGKSLIVNLNNLKQIFKDRPEFLKGGFGGGSSGGNGGDDNLFDNLEQGGIKNIRDYFTTGETGYSQMFIEDYQKRVNNEIMRIAKMNVVLRDRLGRRMSVRNLAEMQVRFEEQQNDCKRLKDKGVEYVVATSHNNASERCQPWQGKIFKLDAEIGSVEIGKHIFKGEPKPIGKTPDGKPCYSLREAMSYGFLGYNCRHRLIEYTKGMIMPKPYPDRQVKNERAKEKHIREMERKIREKKRQSMLTTDKEERKKLQEETKELEKDYWKYCKENDYPVAEWRTRVSLEERQGLKSGEISFEPSSTNGGNTYQRGSLMNGGASGNGSSGGNGNNNALKGLNLTDDDIAAQEKFERLSNTSENIYKVQKLTNIDQFAKHLPDIVKLDRTIVLTEKSRQHILDGHEEISEHIDKLLDYVNDPDLIVSNLGAHRPNGGKDSLNIVKYFDKNHKEEGYLFITVSFKDIYDKYANSIITARKQTRPFKGKIL